MGCTRLVYYAAAIALALSAQAYAKAKPQPATDASSFLDACGPKGYANASYCDGYVEGVSSQIKFDYVGEICPPPIVENGAMGQLVAQYLAKHPDRISRPITDTVFAVMAAGYACRIKRM